MPLLKALRYSCSSGDCGVSAGSVLGSATPRWRGEDRVRSPGLLVVSVEPLVASGDVVSSVRDEGGVARPLPRVPRGEAAVSGAPADADAPGEAASAGERAARGDLVARGEAEAPGEAVAAAGDPVAPGEAVAIGEDVAAGEVVVIGLAPPVAAPVVVVAPVVVPVAPIPGCGVTP
jgi:hypothetical protein